MVLEGEILYNINEEDKVWGMIIWHWRWMKRHF